MTRSVGTLFIIKRQRLYAVKQPGHVLRLLLGHAPGSYAFNRSEYEGIQKKYPCCSGTSR